MIYWKPEVARSSVRKETMMRLFAFTLIFPQVASVHDTIIIGAGWSGLAAAKTLQGRGVNDFVVLDAHDYIGGRSKTAIVYDDVFMEEGSGYLTGIGDNRIYEIAQEFGTSMVTHNYNYDVFLDGALFPNDGTDTFWNYYQGIYNDWGTQWVDGVIDETSSLADVIENYEALLNLEPDSNEEALLRAAKERVSYAYAANLTKFGAYAGNFDLGSIGGIVIPKKGFTDLVEQYAESIISAIELEAKVTKVDYSENPAVVTYVNKDDEEVVIQGKQVLVTVPIGILKAGDIEFIPPFAENGETGLKKQNAIDVMNPGKYEKIALFWKDMTEDEIFWDVSVEHTIHIDLEDEDQQGNFTHWNSYYHVNQVALLESSASERFVDIIEDLSDEEVVAQAVERLRSFYGADAVPDPSHYKLPRWYADEYTKTVYGFAEVGADFDTRTDLRATLNERLFFAGEATYEWHMGTVHGAYNSGVRAAYLMSNTSWWVTIYEFVHYYFPPTSLYCRQAGRAVDKMLKDSGLRST